MPRPYRAVGNGVFQLLNHRGRTFWAGLAVSLLLLALLVYQIRLGEVLDALAGVNYFYVVPAVGLYFAAVFFRALRWRYLLAPIGSFSVGRLYPVVVIGYTANNLLPARLGEVVRAYYLAQRERCSTGAALGTVAVERVYDGLTLLAVAALSGPALLLLGRFDAQASGLGDAALALVAFTVAIFVLALAFLTLAASPRFQGLIQRALGLVPLRLRPRVAGFVGRFLQGLLVLNSPRKHLAVFVLSLPVWLLEGAMYFLVIYAFGIQHSFPSVGVLVLAAALLTATSNLATALPTSIGGIGPFEVVAQQTLVALGVGASEAAAYAGFLHLVALWLPVNLAGLALLWKQNLSLGRLLRPSAEVLAPKDAALVPAVLLPKDGGPKADGL